MHADGSTLASKQDVAVIELAPSRRAAGHGPVVLMDDDAQAFAISHGSSRTRFVGVRIYWLGSGG